VQDARAYGRSCRVQTHAGTNFVVQLLKTTIGKIETGQVVIVDIRLENPNPFGVELERTLFVLTSSDASSYRPETTGTQTRLINLPANGVLDKEALSYAVPDGYFVSPLMLRIGADTIMIKDNQPFERRLGNGQFLTFRRRHW
jgi:hypothetical protein